MNDLKKEIIKILKKNPLTHFTVTELVKITNSKKDNISIIMEELVAKSDLYVYYSKPKNLEEGYVYMSEKNIEKLSKQ